MSLTGKLVWKKLVQATYRSSDHESFSRQSKVEAKWWCALWVQRFEFWQYFDIVIWDMEKLCGL